MKRAMHSPLIPKRVHAGDRCHHFSDKILKRPAEILLWCDHLKKSCLLRFCPGYSFALWIMTNLLYKHFGTV